MSKPTNFIFRLRVRYAECDGQAVVFNARYWDYIDLAATEYFRHTYPGGYPALFASGYDCQVVSQHMDWMAPAKFDDVLDIEVQHDHIGNSSYHLRFDFRRHSDGLEIAKAKVVYVVVDNQHYRKTNIPQALRNGLSDNAHGVVVDQSGQVTTAKNAGTP